MPDLDDLDHFDEGLPVDPLPASEVRRRGDRMRHRNTVLATVGGVAAAAVFIGIPVAVMSGQGADEDIRPTGPAPSSTAASGGQWLQSVPSDYPLAAGFPETNGDGSPTGLTGTSGVAEVSPCNPVDRQLASASDVRGTSYRGETEDRAGRAIAVFEDEQAARDALAEVGLSLCDARDDYPYLPSDLTLESQPVEVDLGTDDSYAFFERTVATDGSLSDLRVVLVARTGNALFVAASLGAAAGDQQVEFEANRLTEAAARPLEAMCVFSADPCEITSTQATEPAPDPPSSEPPSDALADFPLHRGYPQTNGVDGSPVGVTGAPGVGRIDLCGTVAWDPAAGTTDVIGVEYAGEAEDFRGRTLAIYESEAQAADAVDTAAAALEACPEEASDAESGASSVYESVDADLGDQSTAWTQRYRTEQGGFDTGLTVYHLVRVGSAVYASYEYGEGGGSDDSILTAVLRATSQALPIVEAMRGL